MNELVVYTAIFGNSDRLWSAETGGVPHIAFVDSKKVEYGLKGEVAKVKTWQQVVVEPGWDNRRSARHFKTLPQYYMPDYAAWIWVDCNVRLKITPQKALEDYLHTDFATFQHPDRNCLYVEADFCAKAKKDTPSMLGKQIERYRKEGMPERWGLAETRIVMRRNTESIRALNVAWWEEIEANSVRDQVSLPYVCWKRGTKWEVIPGRCGPIHPSGPWQYLSHLRS